MTRGTPGRLASILALAVATAPLAQHAHAQPEAWPDDDPIPPPPPVARSEPPSPRTVRDLLREDSELGDRYRAARSLTIGGGVTMGVGLGMALVAGGIALVEAPFARTDLEGEPIDYAAARDTRVVVVSLLVVAGVATIGGATALGIGATRKQAVVDRARRMTLGLGPRGLALRF